MKTLKEYCSLFAKIKVNKTQKRGEAPYKPILLLSIIDLISQGIIKNNQINVSEQLIERFNQYWEILSPESFNGGLALPFFHLKNDGFWKLQFSENYDGGRPQTLPKLKEDVDYAIIDDELFKILQDQSSKQQLVDTLISAWFSSSQKNIEDILTINTNLSTFIELTDNQPKSDLSIEIVESQKRYLKKSVMRSAFFRKTIIHLYDYKCSICGLKVITSLNQSIIEGAHIKPFSLFYDSSHVNNGIALCKNHHWAFDNGLLSINNDYTIIVATTFKEESPNSKSLQEFCKQPIILPESEKNFPSIEAIQWHRNYIFEEKLP